ncbi:MAG TPA: LysM peptidoglycan-binding domain-containing protein [Ilumatobacteraceae bacterium]|nr:LysM peptidoglycan-binding domain-containing protein [Ilumatobacteraceae bacterium]
MQHDDFDDPYGFWNDLPTRQFQRSHVGARAHGDTQAMPRVQTRMVPVVRTQRNHVPPPQRPRNPLMARILVMVGVGLLLVPVALGLRADKPRVRAADVKAVDPIFIGTMPAAPTDATVAPDTEAPATTLGATTAVTPAPTEAAPSTVAPTEPPTTAAQPKKKVAPKPATTPAPTIAPVAAATQTASCSATYTIASGDTWSGIASRAKVTMNSLLAANNATTSTLLLPGKSICLPEDAQQPGPPTTKAPTPKAPTTTQPATTQPKSTTPTTTQPPPPTVTTAPGTTQPAPPPNTYTKAQAAQIIRDVWPDELENSAIAIATRESNLIPTAHNYCCYGLFQIYYNAHKTWLASIGVTSAAQLYDPLVNATAAYALYRSSGWSPWGGDPLATTTTTVAP